MQGKRARIFLNPILIPMAILALASCGGGGGSATNTPATPAATGTLSIVAGTPGGEGYADGVGSEARFRYPSSVAVDSHGNVFVADSSNSTIRKITTSGVVSTFAGDASQHYSAPADGTGTDALFAFPEALTIDANDVLYVADNSAVRKITPAGEVSTLAGSLQARGNVDGNAADARFARLTGIAIDPQGNLFVSDTGNQTIRKIATDGSVTTLAGTAGVSGYSNGQGSTASFNSPWGLALDSNDNLYVADRSNGAIRKITTTGDTPGTVSTFADSTTVPGYLNHPMGIAIDANDNLFVSDLAAIVQITPLAQASYFVGGYPQGYLDATGTDARFFQVEGLAIDAAGTLYAADLVNQNIRKISATGVVTTLAGLPTNSGSEDGPGTRARFNSPVGITADPLGNLFVADTRNLTIRAINSGGNVSTLAGSAGSQGTIDANGTSARFHSPNDIAADASGNLYVLDWYGIRRITSDGDVTTLIGVAGSTGKIDVYGNITSFAYLTGLTVDAYSNVYVSDSGSLTIQKISPTGEVSTLAGLVGSAGTVDGSGASSRFIYPLDITLGHDGNLYVIDGPSIRKITLAGLVSTLPLSSSIEYMQHITADSRGNLYVSTGYSAAIYKISPSGVVSLLAGGNTTFKIIPGNLPASLNAISGMTVVGNKLYATDSSENVVISIDLN